MLIFSFQMVTTSKAVAGDLNLAQSILPVKFIYINGRGYVNDIWSNVAIQDDLYVVKFFNEKREELPATKKLFLQYAQKSQTVLVQRDITQSNDFVIREAVAEEILTIV